MADGASVRWLGLRSYQESDAHLFFGRETEISELFGMIRRETLSMVFAPSGAGKTSLLRAGLFPLLREHDYLPIRLRLDHDTPGVDHAWAIREAVEAAAHDASLELDTVVPPQGDPEEETLWEYLHRIELWSADGKLVTPVIVLDQFEEVFTIGKRRPESAAFLSALADTVEARMPRVVRNRLNERRQRSTIPTEVQGFKIVLSLREDFVAYLDDLRRKMPSIMHNRLLLHSLNGAQALDVVLKPGEGIVEPAVAERIVRYVSSSSKGEQDMSVPLSEIGVEPSLLSMICHELDQQRRAQGLERISADRLEVSGEDIIRNYYEESFEGVERSARTFVEDDLLTHTGYRKAAPIDDAINCGLSRDAMNKLIDRHLLRKVVRNNIPHVELTHDLLSSVVYESRDRRREIEENARLRRARKLQHRKIQFFVVATTILIVLSTVACYQTFQARRSQVRAEATAERVESLLEIMATGVQSVPLELRRQIDEPLLSDTSPAGTLTRARILNEIGHIMARRGNGLSAIESHQAAVQLIESTLTETIDTPLQLEHEIQMARLSIDQGESLTRWGDISKAVESLDRAEETIGRLPPDASSTSLQRLRLDIGRAGIEVRRGLYQAASDRLTRVLGRTRVSEQMPDNTGASEAEFKIDHELARASALRLLTEAKLRHGHIPEAFQYARQNLALAQVLSIRDPDNEEWAYRESEALRLLGSVHLHIEEFEGARDKLEPALTIALDRVANPFGDGLRNQATDSVPWLFSVAETSVKLTELWLDKHERAALYHASQPICRQQAERYLDLATRMLNRIRSAASENTPVTTLMRARVLLLKSRIVQMEGSPGENASKALDTLATADQMLASVVDRLPNYGPVIRERADVLLQIAAFHERYIHDRDRPAALTQAIKLLGDVVERDASDDAARRDLARAQRQLALAMRNRGRSEEAIALYVSAIKSLDSLAADLSDDPVNLRSRAGLRLEYARYMASTAIDDRARQRAIELLEQAYGEFASLNVTVTSPEGEEISLWWVQDRLDAAMAKFEIGRLYERLNRRDLSRKLIREASALGLHEATSELEDLARDAKSDEEAKWAAIKVKQERRETYLPAVLLDKMPGDTHAHIRRKLFVPVIITAPIDAESQALEEEQLRVYSDQMVSIDQRVIEEMTKHHLLVKKAETGLSLAMISDNSLTDMDTADRTGQDNSMIHLRSPVTNRYPKSTPTVIGNECWFDWEFVGTAEQLRKFELQISADERFNDLVVAPVTVRGTRYRLDLSSPTLRPYLNRKLYWRVRHLSGIEGPVTTANPGEWSLAREVEVYQTVWDRVLHTGELRVGFTQFEGDLLSIKTGSAEESDRDPGNDDFFVKSLKSDVQITGFDAEVLEHVQAQLQQTRQQQLGVPEDQAKPLKRNLRFYTWEGMFEAISRNEVDMVISTITRTRDRERRHTMHFSEPYYETQIAVIYRKAELNEPKIDDLRKLSGMANEGFRGEEVGSLVLESQIASQSHPSLAALVQRVRDKDTQLAFTDMAFIQRQQAQTPELLEGLGVFPIEHKHYQRLLELEKARDPPRADVVDRIEQMSGDFGGSEWEQYAIGTSANDDGQLLKHINRAILEYRRSDQLLKACEHYKLFVPKRLIGKDQRFEHERHLANVVPRSPKLSFALRLNDTQLPVVMGPKIPLEWSPLDHKSTGQYRVQIATSSTFLPTEIVLDRLFPDTSVALDASVLEGGVGKFVWRAKRLAKPDFKKPEDDPYPLDGWCNSIGFEYYPDSLARMRHTKQLIVAVNVSNGFSVYRAKDLELAGFDIEIINAIKKHIVAETEIENLDIRFVEMDFTQMFPMVQHHQVDMAISGITKTPEREADYDIRFSDAYCRTRQAVIWARNNGINDAGQLFGKPFIVFEQTRAETVAQRFTPQVDSTRDNPKAYLLAKIASGDAAATITDYPAAIKLVEDYVRSSPNARFEVQPIARSLFIKNSVKNEDAESFFVDEYAVPMHENETRLHAIVNGAIRELRGPRKAEFKKMFDKHQHYDKKRFKVDPFELQWTDD